MGCGPSKGSTTTIASNLGNGVANPDKLVENDVIPPPVAFVVPLDETEKPPTLSEGLPPPPLRIQKLLEETPKEPPSPTKIEKRLASAERRRQQVSSAINDLSLHLFNIYSSKIISLCGLFKSQTIFLNFRFYNSEQDPQCLEEKEHTGLAQLGMIYR